MHNFTVSVASVLMCQSERQIAFVFSNELIAGILYYEQRFFIFSQHQRYYKLADIVFVFNTVLYKSCLPYNEPDMIAIYFTV